MSVINFSNFYASKYVQEDKHKCCVCKKIYSKTYNLKHTENDKDLLDVESGELFHICRKCMIVNSVDTKIRYRCDCCHSFYKSKCMKCEKDKRLKIYVLEKIKILLLKVNQKKDLDEIKEEIQKL